MSWDNSHSSSEIPASRFLFLTLTLKDAVRCRPRLLSLDQSLRARAASFLPGFQTIYIWLLFTKESCPWFLVRRYSSLSISSLDRALARSRSSTATHHPTFTHTPIWPHTRTHAHTRNQEGGKMMRYAALTLAAAGLASAQTWSLCNPVKGDGEPPHHPNPSHLHGRDCGARPLGRRTRRC